MQGQTVLLRHTSNGKGQSVITKSRGIDTIQVVYSHRDEQGNPVIGVDSGDIFSVEKCPNSKAVWQTVS